VGAFQETHALLSLTGPAPALESLCALHTPPGPPSVNGIAPVVALPDDALVGCGSPERGQGAPPRAADRQRAPPAAGGGQAPSLTDMRVAGGALELPPLAAEAVLQETCARVGALLRRAVDLDPAALLGTGALPTALDPAFRVVWILSAACLGPAAVQPGSQPTEVLHVVPSHRSPPRERTL